MMFLFVCIVAIIILLLIILLLTHKTTEDFQNVANTFNSVNVNSVCDVSSFCFSLSYPGNKFGYASSLQNNSNLFSGNNIFFIGSEGNTYTYFQAFINNGDLQFLSNNSSGSIIIWNTNTTGNNSLIMSSTGVSLSMVDSLGNPQQTLLTTPSLNLTNCFLVVNFGGLTIYDQSFNWIYPNKILVNDILDKNDSVSSFFGKYKLVIKDFSLQILDTTRNNLINWCYGPINPQGLGDPVYVTLSNSNFCLYSQSGTTVSSNTCFAAGNKNNYALVLNDIGILSCFDVNGTKLFDFNTTTNNQQLYSIHNDNNDISSNISSINTFNFIASPNDVCRLYVTQYFDSDSRPSYIQLEMTDSSSNTIIWYRKIINSSVAGSYFNYFKLAFDSLGDVCLMDSSFNDCVNVYPYDFNACIWKLSNEGYVPSTSALYLAITDNFVIQVMDNNSNPLFSLDTKVTNNTFCANIPKPNSTMNPGECLTSIDGSKLCFDGNYLRFYISDGTLKWQDGTDWSQIQCLNSSWNTVPCDPSNSYLGFGTAADGLPVGSIYMYNTETTDQWVMTCTSYTSNPNAQCIQVNNSEDTFSITDSQGNIFWTNTDDIIDCSGNIISLN